MSAHGSPTLPQVRLEATLAALGFRRAHAPPADDVSGRTGRGLFRVTRAIASMGTRVSVTALSPSPARAEEGVGRALEELGRVVALLDRRNGASAVSALNASGSLRRPPPELFQVLTAARDVHRLSGGCFDVTVQPLVDALMGPASPTPESVSDALGLVDMSALRASPRRVRLRREGMGLTLDGIGKGYVVDRTARTLDACGIHDWLIDAGGDVRASGRGPGGGPWTVGVRDPGGGAAFPDVVALRNRAVATSGGYERFRPERPAVHHVVDRATGRSAAGVRSASVVAPTAMLADALATAALVMAPSAALPFLSALPGCAGFLIDRAGRAHASPEWRVLSTRTLTPPATHGPNG